MPADLATSHLAPIIAEFAKTYPLIDFQFDLSPRSVDLLTEPFDLAIRIGPPPPGPLTLVAWPIAELAHYLYASPEYLTSAAPLTHRNDLDRHVVCIVEGTMRLGVCGRPWKQAESVVGYPHACCRRRPGSSPPSGTSIVLPSRNGRMRESLTAWRYFHTETSWSISAKAAISASTFFCGE